MSAKVPPYPTFLPLSDVKYALSPFTDFGILPIGRRLYASTSGGAFEGDSIKGEILPGGTDRILIGDDGTARIDADMTLRTDSGALIHAHWTGYMVADIQTSRLLTDTTRRASIPLADYSFRLSASLETGDEALGWLNRTIAVGRAAFTAQGLHYRFLSVDPV